MAKPKSYKGLAVALHGHGMNLGNELTTAPTTGLTKGDVFLVWKSSTHPVLAMCVSQATQLVQYIAGFNADTLGIAST